jgi:hypothetical protein
MVICRLNRVNHADWRTSFGVTTFGNDTHPNSSNYYFWAGSEPKFGYSGVTVSGITENGAGLVSANLSFARWAPGKK